MCDLIEPVVIQSRSCIQCNKMTILCDKSNALIITMVEIREKAFRFILDVYCNRNSVISTEVYTKPHFQNA